MKKLFSLAILLSLSLSAALAAKPKQPNILVIWGDDIGWFSLSAYHNGVMGARTPNIDRLAKEGMLFTDAYGEQSCTAGRSAFILGQHPVRTGLSKVGMPGAPQGISELDPTIAAALKDLGYNTGQFGKNHLGDRDEHLPTNHGFDEFYGNLYHLNAEEEPEEPTYPKDPAFKKRFGPRGVIKSSADGAIRDTGPLTKKRMETIDEEFAEGAKAFMNKSVEEGKPFFCWLNSSRMHNWTRLKESSQKSGFVYHDGLEEHDALVGEVLNYLEELKIDENTIVLYSTDNGAMKAVWPHAGASPFRSEKATTWEGGVRVPMLVRWPGSIEAGTVSNEIISQQDWFPTLLAAAGNETVAADLKKGTQLNGKSYKVHLDGYNFLPYLTGKATEGPRKEIVYSNDNGEVTAIRLGDWKSHFKIQKGVGMDIWRNEWVTLNGPLIYNLREDPFEAADVDAAGMYTEWFHQNIPRVYEASAGVMQFFSTFEEFPRRQKPGTFTF
ncbi:arylsulfatase [Persicobacter diffluens]|uniref:Arylsulfatase n=1 Tax=Persicobacter diffluens TaxID=981 RepID=A0AAN4W0Y3_9BACT|nr:arylsulfatase [Persicobacter diffluens]